ncbi:uncharacterized protein NEMAJ01_1658 [Nematocida major]|uniref:uncharacterized protein n=1 Tax=Nematocida major TaxID=1912982 RepID=UPI0020076DB5|nr:uncharacterized protein NEMAJ01_1658 [Nematocida major]KAH9386762.1 hypothetical protein NEMAJ01_1658 [Nematocida major]
MFMDELWRALFVGLVVYGNYLLFSGHFMPIFWAVCYSVLCKQVGKKHVPILQPFLLLLSSFPLLSLAVLPSVLVLLCGNELKECAVSAARIISTSPETQTLAKKVLAPVLFQISQYLEIHSDQTLSESVVYYKIYLKIISLKEEILQGSQSAVSLLGQTLFFVGFTGYFYKLQNNPLYYVLKPIPRHASIISAFENIVHSMAVGSAYGFLCGFILCAHFGSPLVVTSAVASAFLTVFPVMPLCLYGAPTAAFLWAEGKRVSAFAFFCLCILQQLYGRKTFGVEMAGGKYLKSVSVLLGLRVFGYPGVILGPLLLSSLLILWPSDKAPAEPLQKPVERAKRPKNMTKAMEILRKGR